MVMSRRAASEAEGPAEAGGAQSVDRALSLLSLVSRHGDEGVSIAAIVSETSLSRPTVRRLMLALIRAHLVEQDEATRRYFLGSEAFALGVLAARRYGIQDAAVERLAALSSRSGDTTFLCLRRGSYAVCTWREEGHYPIRTHALQVGYHHPLGVGAGSLAMLAALSDEEIEAVLAENAEALAEGYPHYSAPILREAVAEARGRGWSLNPGLVVQSSWAIGCAVHYPNGRLAGAISLSAIDSRLAGERQVELGALLMEEARRIEAKLATPFGAGAGAAPSKAASAPAAALQDNQAASPRKTTNLKVGGTR